MKKHIWYPLLFPLLLAGCGKEPQPQKIAARTVKVRTATLEKHEFREIFRAQGMVEAARKGTISSFVPGRIDKIFFEEGSIAEAGASLFQVDLQNLTNRVELARKDLEVAKATRLSTEQGVKLARIRREKAERDFKRNRTLYRSKAVSTDTYEQAETAFNSATVMLEGAVALDRAAMAKVQQAETALKLAEQTLKDSHPSVPFRALILEKFKEESEFAGPGVPILAVEDPTSREICCRISASSPTAAAAAASTAPKRRAAERIRRHPRRHQGQHRRHRRNGELRVEDPRTGGLPLRRHRDRQTQGERDHPLRAAQHG